MRRIPWMTLALAGTAIALHATPAAHEWLVYDRARVSAGESWRLVTGSLVHFSTSHVALDVAAFGVGGALAERGGRLRFAVLVAAALVGVGIAVHGLAPSLARYAGLSGVAFAVLAAAALDLSRDAGTSRWLGMGAVALLLAKLATDLARATPLLVDAGAGIVAAPIAHAAGACTALLVAVASARRRAAFALACLVALGACARPTQHVRHQAAAAPVVLRHVRPNAGDTSVRALPRRLGVAVARDARPVVTGGLFASPGGTARLDSVERAALAERVASLLRRQPPLGGVEIVVLDGVEHLAAAALRERFGLDALCVVGFEQTRRTSNSRFVLLEAALLFPPIFLPTLHSETWTLLDVAAVRLDDGRPMFRAGTTSRVEGRGVPLYPDAHYRDQRGRGLSDAVAALAPELEHVVAAFGDNARSASAP